MVTGSVASMVYGEPRLTLAVDLVVALALPRARCAATSNSSTTRPAFMKADVYVAADDDLHRWGLANRRLVLFEGMELPLAPPEYVIVRKLEFWREGGSEKHVRDVRAMLEAGLVLDNTFLETEIRARSLQEA